MKRVRPVQLELFVSAIGLRDREADRTIDALLARLAREFGRRPTFDEALAGYAKLNRERAKA